MASFINSKFHGFSKVTDMLLRKSLTKPDQRAYLGRVVCSEQKVGSRAYSILKQTMEANQLGYVAARLPPDHLVEESSFDVKSGAFSLKFGKNAGLYPVTKEGVEMPGASVKVGEVIEGTISQDSRQIQFKKGLEATVLNGFQGGIVEEVSANKHGQIAVKAKTSIGFVSFALRQTFDPENSMSFLGWNFHPKSINVNYPDKVV